LLDSPALAVMLVARSDKLSAIMDSFTVGSLFV
jgi:hypothetical protein